MRTEGAGPCGLPSPAPTPPCPPQAVLPGSRQRGDRPPAAGDATEERLPMGGQGPPVLQDTPDQDLMVLQVEGQCVLRLFLES